MNKKYKVGLCLMVLLLILITAGCKPKSPEFPAKGLIEYQEYMVGMERTFTKGVIVYLHEEGKGAGKYYAISAPGLSGEHLFITVQGSIADLRIGNLVNIEGEVAVVQVKNEQIPYLQEISKQVVGKISKEDPDYGAYAELIEGEIQKQIAAIAAVIAAIVAVIAATTAAR